MKKRKKKYNSGNGLVLRLNGSCNKKRESVWKPKIFASFRFTLAVRGFFLCTIRVYCISTYTIHVPMFAILFTAISAVKTESII